MSTPNLPAPTTPREPPTTSGDTGRADTTPPPAPWEQQRGESGKAYEAFVKYRDATPSERSQRRVAAELGKSSALIGRWSSTWSWVARVEAWDREQDRLWQADMAVRRRSAARRQLQLAQAALGKVAQGLVHLDADKLTPSELTKLFQVAVQIERDAIGAPQRVEVSGPEGSPLAVQVDAFAQMGVEQRRLAVVDMMHTLERRVRAAQGLDDDD